VSRRYLAYLVFQALAIASPAVAQTVAAPGSPESSSAPAPPPPSAFVTATDPYAAKGLPVGGFRFFPTIEITGDYDDNVFLSQTNPQQSFFGRETPQAMLHSDWSRHELDVYAAGSFYQYEAFPLQDHIDWDAGGDGRLDIFQGVNLAGGGSYSVEHLANSSPDQPTNAKAPTEFSIVQSNATLSYNPYHFGFYVGGTFNRYVYDPSELINGTLEANDDRNEDTYAEFVKASYEFSPGYAAFIQGNENSAHYDLALDRSDLPRDNSGFSGNAGVDMLITTLIRGQAFVGYLDQRFKAPFHDVPGLNFGANVDWAVASLWTLHFIASRSLNGTTLATASTEDDKSFQVSADYQFRSNITVSGGVTYLDATFDGSTRVDRYITPRAAVTYHMNPWIGIELADTFQRRDSTVSGQGFNDNIATVGVKFQE
jgi:hypothetical protein